ncbi:PadR family transcriptional regulator [Nocardioides sp.]|uniref:PadR family transcriptional regulator n=1 Tax=Nocardioides sp. TaxID=35761 RepID=UPI0039E41F6B
MTGNKNWRHHPGAGNWGAWGEWTDQPGGGRGPRHGGRGPQGGPPPWAAALFGFQQPDQRRGPRVRRGDVRTAILSVLAEAQGGEAVNGYQVIQQIAAKSNGAWRPSPGSVYPTIQQLEDEGLVFSDEATGRRALLLTAEGQAYVADHADELAAVWLPFQPREERASAGSEFKSTLKSEIGQVATAVWQLASQGSEGQRQAALGVLVETRRKLYGILADGPEGPESDASDES